jgi:hypothetical protein
MRLIWALLGGRLKTTDELVKLQHRQERKNRAAQKRVSRTFRSGNGNKIDRVTPRRTNSTAQAHRQEQLDISLPQITSTTSNEHHGKWERKNRISHPKSWRTRKWLRNRSTSRTQKQQFWGRRTGSGMVNSTKQKLSGASKSARRSLGLRPESTTMSKSVGNETRN